ncbi:MAG: helix-turn-helix domain-containing protein [Candidatus Phlomobacter fragariae]
MSRIATNWVWSINLKASQKLLLLALADRDVEHHCCYPSIQRLSNDTGLDRKTICRQINQMITEGLIIDTGERKGATKQVKVLKLNIDLKHTQKRNSTEVGNDPKTVLRIYQ